MTILRKCITLVALLALFVSCEEGGDYLQVPSLPARVYVYADVYNLHTGERETDIDLTNTGLIEYPQGVEANTTLVIQGEQDDQSCCDTLCLPALKPGDVAYCHLNLFLYPSYNYLVSSVVSSESYSDYEIPSDANKYFYQDTNWIQNASEMILYSDFGPSVCPQDTLKEQIYVSNSLKNAFQDLIQNMESRDYYLDVFSYYASAWSLTRFQRESLQRDIRYRLFNTFTDRCVQDFILTEKNTILVYSQEEVAHPKFKDFYVPGQGFGSSYDGNPQVGFEANRAGGGIFYED